MSRSDGEVLSRESSYIVFNGPPERKWNVVILGDGFRRDGMVDEIPIFEFSRAECYRYPAKHSAVNRLRSAINVYRVNIRSDQSGADEPLQCGGSGATPVPFSTLELTAPEWDLAKGWRFKITGLHTEVAWQAVPQVHVVIVLVDSITIRRYLLSISHGSGSGRLPVHATETCISRSC